MSPTESKLIRKHLLSLANGRERTARLSRNCITRAKAAEAAKAYRHAAGLIRVTDERKA